MNIDEQRLQQFFTELNAKRKAFAENYKYFAPQLAPQFNCFDFINSDENKLSEIIAHLLNPQATHAQNDLFLQLFFKKIEIKYPDCDQQVTVNCEVVTHSIKNNQRRIDILVDFEKDCFGLAIENKPWTRDQNEQLSDYANHLKNVYQDKYCLIYLSGDASDPNEESISEEKRNELEENRQYKKINYSDIVSWLEQCEKESKSDHVKHFLRDFIAYCQQEFSGATNMIDKDVIEKTILENDNNIGLAIEIAAQLPAIKEKLLEKFMNDLGTKFTEKYPDWTFQPSEWVFNITNFSLKDFIYFYKESWEYYHIAIYYESGLYWGVRRQDNKIGNNIPPELIESLSPDKLKTANHTWWCYFPEPYSGNWASTTSVEIKPWIGIQSGQAVEIVMEKITKLIDVGETILDNLNAEEAKKNRKKGK